MPFNNFSNNNNKNYIHQSPSTVNSNIQSPSGGAAANNLINKQQENGVGNDYQASFPNISSNYFSSNTTTSTTATNCLYSEDANKAFDDVVFNILKVDPDHIAGQLTLIDIPLFKLIEPDELISCKWMSRDKLVKAPNIVQFTRRFNQTAFWCQREILNCKRIETRGKMLTHFIKIAKRLNELHSFNSLMAIIVALKSAPIFRLKKTWSQHVSKRDLAYFERMADLMFDTSDNKRKIRDMHMNCKLPCIPFLGLFLTDLIHIDIAHPHNAFDNPQRRNQMNNICRLISEYQQSNYQDMTSLSCSCCFGTTTTTTNNNTNTITNNNLNTNTLLLNQMDDFTTTNNTSCITPNCSCDIHHGHGYGGGMINNDGTIYISEINYVKNYLNSFLYIEELQKFKEDDNYRESLELEPDPGSINNNNSANTTDNSNSNKLSDSLTPSNYFSTSSPCKLINNSNNFNSVKFGDSGGGVSNLKTDTIDLINDLKLKHPLDDSIVEPDHHISNINNNNNSNNTGGLPNLTASILPISGNQAQLTTNNNSINNNNNSNDNENSQSKTATTNKITDPSLLKVVLNKRHQISNSHSSNGINNENNKNHHHHQTYSLKNRFNCISSNTTDLEDDEEDENTDTNSNVNNNNNHHKNNSETVDNQSDQINIKDQQTPIKVCNLSFESSVDSSKKTKNGSSKTINDTSRRLSGRNLAKSLNAENNDLTDKVDSAIGIHMNNNQIIMTPNLSSSDLFKSSLVGENNNNNNNRDDSNRTNNTDLSSLSSILGYEQHLKLILFESPVKRKCIIKNYRKPRFSQWKSYWLQLIGGNLLVYYSTKSVLSTFNGLTTNQRRNSTTSNQSYFMVDQFHLDSEIKSIDIVSTNSVDQQKQDKLQQLQTQLQNQKVLYNKNPCKMHPIANWMVVNLYQDKENEILAQIDQQTSAEHQSSTLNSSQKYNKFDIQLNDLNNGNMYKYRFDSLQLAKEWFEQFKLASTFHERQKPDNLIRFD